MVDRRSINIHTGIELSLHEYLHFAFKKSERKKFDFRRHFHGEEDNLW